MKIGLKGVGAAIITPFDAENKVDFEGLKKVLTYVEQGNTDYFVINGTTGESATTSNREKAAILEFAKKNNPKNLPIVYGIGGNNTAEVIERIQESDLSGVTAILSVCPYYVKPSQVGIIEHFKVIADASPIPILLYNVPGRTMTSIAVSSVLELAKHPNIVGLKDASCSIEIAMELSKYVPDDFLLVSGDDNLVTAQISLGYQGVISVIANGFPAEFSKMTWAALKGDFETAREIQFRFLDFDNLLYAESNPVGIKAVCEIRGLCDGRVRLPLAKASNELFEKLKHSMLKEGFL